MQPPSGWAKTLRLRIALLLLLASAGFASSVIEAPPVQATLSFGDEFETGGLRPAWKWENPGGSSAYGVAGDLFNLVVLPKNDQWSNVDKGARILKPQLGSSWTIETKLSASSGNATSFGGLTVFKDAENWISFGWLQESSLELSGIVNGAFTGPVGVSAWYEYLRLRKAGNAYFADASNDGRHWTNVNRFDDTTGVLRDARVGFLGKNWGELGPYSVSIEYFREYDVDLMPTAGGTVQSTRKVGQITGADSPNRTQAFNVCGTDYGIMFAWQNKTYLAFGDTQSCRPTSDDRPNTLAFSSDTNPSDGLRLDGWVTDARGEAKSLFVADGDALTAVPTAAIGVGDTAYIYYANIVSWNMPPGSWSCSRSSIATASAVDHGAWSKQIDSISWAQGGFNQVAVLRDPAPGSTRLFIFGTSCGRFGSVKLMTVDEGRILDKTAYRYFAGLDGQDAPIWSASESSAVTVAGGPAGELSAAFNPYLQRYVLTYLDQGKHGIVMREAATPWGPWSPPTVIAPATEFEQLYGAYTSPAFVKDNGKTFYFAMSQYGPYNTYWMETVLP